MLPEKAENQDAKWLNRKKQRACAVLARTGSEDEAGKAAGVSARTVRNWRDETLFKDALRTEQANAVEEFREQFREAARKGLEVLKAILDDTQAADRDKVAAAKIVIDRYLGDAPAAPAVEVNVSGNAQVALCSPAEMAKVAEARRKALGTTKDEEKNPA